jgi:hypothetical protein
MTKTRILQSGLCLSIFSLALASCGKPQTAASVAGPPVAAPVAAPAPAATQTRASVAANSALLAAGEPFENLTEQALTAPASTLDGLIAKGQSAAQSVRGYLPATAIAEFDAKLAEIKTARQANQRTDLALASIEIYRILISAVTPPVKTPAPVNMLDYAGFRYNADLMAKPTRWTDMTGAITVARNNWSQLQPQVTDPALWTQVDAAIADMETAAMAQNTKKAASAVKRELDLVDALEKFFNKR